MALLFKKGVIVDGVTTHGINIISNGAYAYEAHGYNCVVTSVKDGKHSKNSKHYIGDAADFRIWHVKPQSLISEILGTLRRRLGNDYDVLLEKDHIHVEYDPKGKYHERNPRPIPLCQVRLHR